MATLTLSVIVIITWVVIIIMISYSREQLLNLQPTTRNRISLDVYNTVRELNICSVGPTRRGHRSFSKQQKTLPTIVTNRVPSNKLIRQVNHDNLTQLPRVDNSTDCLNVCLWNAQSVRNKSLYICDYILEHDLDIMIITESWIKEN